LRTRTDASRLLFNGKVQPEESVVMADVVLVSAGRAPFTEGLNLEAAGVAMEKRRIPVNHKMQTNVPHIYAIGDVTGGGLAHVASMEGIVAAENITGHEARMDYKAVPACIYTEPEVASVGLTEQEARDKGYDVRVGSFPFTNLGKAMAMNQTNGFVKVIADNKYGEIWASTSSARTPRILIHEAVVSIQLENTVEELMRTIHAHPTLAEAIGQPTRTCAACPSTRGNNPSRFGPSRSASSIGEQAGIPACPCVAPPTLFMTASIIWFGRPNGVVPCCKARWVAAWVSCSSRSGRLTTSRSKHCT
jgi:hypothetical protein